MTRKSVLPLFLFLTILFFTACDEDKYADWKTLNDNAFATELDTTDYTKSESGLCYKIIDPGQMKQPNVNSYVKVNYVGTLITGEVFDEGIYEGYLSSAVVGWQEAIVKLKKGGSMKIFFPYSLGYGTTGSGSIPPYSMLYFKVELLDAQY